MGAFTAARKREYPTRHKKSKPVLKPGQPSIEDTMSKPLIVREPDGSLWLSITEAEAGVLVALNVAEMPAMTNAKTLRPASLYVAVGNLEITTRENAKGYLGGPKVQIIVDGKPLSVTSLDLHIDMISAVTAKVTFLPKTEEKQSPLCAVANVLEYSDSIDAARLSR